MAVWPHRLGPGPWNWGRYGVPACQPAGQQKQFCPGPVSAPARPAFPGAHVSLTVRPGGPRLPGSYLTTSVLLFTPTRGPAGSVQDWKWVCPAERVRSFCRKGRYFCRVALSGFEMQVPHHWFSPGIWGGPDGEGAGGQELLLLGAACPPGLWVLMVPRSMWGPFCFEPEGTRVGVWEAQAFLSVSPEVGVGRQSGYSHFICFFLSSGSPKYFIQRREIYSGNYFPPVWRAGLGEHGAPNHNPSPPGAQSQPPDG